jgi:hypothetical protein
MWSYVHPFDDGHLVTETCSGANYICRNEVPVTVYGYHVQTEIVSAICIKILFAFRSTNMTTLWIFEIVLSHPYKPDKVDDDQALKATLN